MGGEPRVFVVDPDAAVRDAIRRLVSTMNLQCELYALGREFLDAYTGVRPGCLVMEVAIPDIPGLEIQKHLASQEPGLPVIFLTAHPDISIAVRAMRAGAIHFLQKPIRESGLWDAIREGLQLGLNRQQAWARRQMIQEDLAQLTPKERRLLEMLAAGKSREAIAREVGVTVRTTERRKGHIMEKLGLKYREQLVHFALAANNGQRPKAHHSISTSIYR